MGYTLRNTMISMKEIKSQHTFEPSALIYLMFSAWHAVFGQTIVAGGAVARNSDVIKSTLKTEAYHDSNIGVPGTPGVVGMTTYGAVGDDIIKQWSSVNNKTSALARFRPVTANSWYVYMDRAKYFVDLDSCYVYSIHPILWQCFNTFLFLQALT